MMKETTIDTGAAIATNTYLTEKDTSIDTSTAATKDTTIDTNAAIATTTNVTSDIDKRKTPYRIPKKAGTPLTQLCQPDLLLTKIQTNMVPRMIFLARQPKATKRLVSSMTRFFFQLGIKCVDSLIFFHHRALWKHPAKV